MRMLNYRILNRDILKYIAALTMFLDHFAMICMEQDSFWAFVFENIGYFTAVTMCYFLVEGFYRTRSRKRYAVRLFVFGIFSQFPYYLAVIKSEPEGAGKLNMMFTLLLCFLLLFVMEKITDGALLVLAAAAIFAASLACDWALLAPGFTLLFWWGYGLERETKIAFAVSSGLLGIFHLAGGILYAAASMTGGALSGLAIVYFYNGKKSETSPKISKWFFYLFYPLHLLLLGILRMAGE